MPAKPITLPVKNKELLTRALTHRSWLNENETVDARSNERLEFLGDAVLELIVTQYLFNKFPDEQEGMLTALRAALVRTESLAEVAVLLDLGNKIRLSKGEELSGGRSNISLLANAFEALIGAIYLEGGMKNAESFVIKHLIPKLKSIREQHLEKDAKSLLQETVQADGYPAPQYKVSKEEGPDHDKVFTVDVYINGQKLSTGTGKSKQQAQQQAASLALEKYRSN